MGLCSGVQAQRPPGATPYTIATNGPQSGGYIFIAPRSLTLLDIYPSTLMLLDSVGQLVWYAVVADDTLPPVSNYPLYDFKPLGPGMLSYFQQKQSGDKFFILDSSFSIVDSVYCLGGRPVTDEHDLAWEPNGHFTMICLDDTVADASGLNTTSGAPGSSSALVSFQTIQSQDASRNVLYDWKLLDRVAIEDSDTAYFTGSSYLDHQHANSVFTRGEEVVISNRNLNEITSFNRQTGAINWRLGGKGNQFTFVGDSLPFKGQHDANFDENGHLYFFDNGVFGDSTVARYVEYALDTVAMVATLVREHRHPLGLRSLFMGNAVKVSNGNVLVDWARLEPDISPQDLTEFRPDGSVAMQLDIAPNYLSYRVHKEPLPFELQRVPIFCDATSNVLSAPAGRDSYWWSTGAQTQHITVQDTGWYQVWASQGMGMMSSERIHVTDVSNLCNAVSGTRPVVNKPLELWPNPARERLSLRLPDGVRGPWRMEIRDALGRLLAQSEGRAASHELDLSEWAQGMYLLRIIDGRGHVYQGKFQKLSP